MTPPLRASTGDRVAAAFAAAALLAILTVAAYLTPDARGHGTHERLGLPTCGWLAASGRPCFTCGMTTSFTYAGQGKLASAFTAQPFGLLLVLGMAAGVWIAGHVAVTGSRVGVVLARLTLARSLWILAGLWAISWIYKLATWPTPA